MLKLSPHAFRASDWPDIVNFAPLFYVMTVMWWIPDGDKYPPAIILAVLVFYIVSQASRNRESAKGCAKPVFSSAITASALICGISYLLHDGSISELRTLAALSVFSWISITFKLNYSAWLSGVFIASAGFISVSYYQYFIEGLPRTHLYYNPIPYATGLATVMVCSLFIAVTSRKLPLTLSAWAVTLLLFSATAMTGTRGVVLPASVILCTVTIYYLCGSKKLRKTAIAATVAALTLITAFGAHIFEDRIDRTVTEFSLIASGNKTSSIGLRLQFWEAASVMATMEPLTGLGEDHKSVYQDLAAQGLVDRTAAAYAPYHYHNQFLDTLVKRGVPGLLALLLLLSLPSALAAKYYRDTPLVLGSIGGMSILYTIASLTDVPFNHPVTINLFVLSSLALFSLKTESQR
ncbi:O-antigen ligase family protein [Marinobacter sp.]|uniref:O-antigen ligase family protein n=1 Tax=Marinobacter sp. TaxID=50741 RepID=UPI002B27869D|nr:O-antigen ligase family protein [Marinobacter sp.]